MTDNSLTSGLSCPRCGGTIPVPEGVAIVACPYCELRSVVRGHRGLRRYQLSCRVDREQASAAFRKFLSSSMAIARDAPRLAQLTEAFVVYLPFWAAWGRGLGWAFGEEEVGSGDNRRHVPKEIRIQQEMAWNGAACDVGEFGVTHVPLANQTLEPFQADALHRAGLVFEPVAAEEDAQRVSDEEFNQRVRDKGRLDRLSQLFVRIVRKRLGLVYYPLWMLRYAYRGRAFQVAVDGTTGQVLYGKAPGNTFYRAAVLVGGMAAGAVLSVDVTSLLLYLMGNSSGDHNGSGLLAVVAVAFFGGLFLMYSAYRRFRYGEQYEYGGEPQENPLQMVQRLGDQYGSAEKILNTLLEDRRP